MIKAQKNKTPVYAGFSIGTKSFFVSICGRGQEAYSEQVKFVGGNVADEVLLWISKFSASSDFKIVAAVFAGEAALNELTSRAWLLEDIVPFFFKSDTAESEQQADNAALTAMNSFGDDNAAKVSLGENRRVRTTRLVGLEDYEKVTSLQEMETLLYFADKFKSLHGKLVFFSSTPRGGGVALMRHALIRMFRLLGVDADWHVMTPQENVFEITKKKFHNVLQGVAPPDVALDEHDKEILRAWTEENARDFEKVFEGASVIVIDDPQPSGMIPFIRKANPLAKIIYRSHIQLETGLMDKKGTQQNILWEYLCKNICQADLFISHPIDEFVPRNIPKEKIALMNATTDKLDGLNKSLSESQLEYYLDFFNKILEESFQEPLDLSRPYVTQVARFDPSKGIPDVLASYRKFRKQMDRSKIDKKDIPQLVIVGHGSVDDPEASIIYSEVMSILSLDVFKKYVGDIKVARLPHSDQLLNAILRKSYLALQLSHKEGFEVKVSEALYKGRPVIAYQTGGIPLQIEHEITGFLVKRGRTSKVADRMFELFTNKEKYAVMSKNAKEMVSQESFTVDNAIKWLYLATEMLENENVIGYGRNVSEMLSGKMLEIESLNFPSYVDSEEVHLSAIDK